MKSQEKTCLVYKNSGEVLNKLESREFGRLVYPHMIFLLCILHYPII